MRERYRFDRQYHFRIFDAFERACNNDSLVYFYALGLCGRGGGNRCYDRLDSSLFGFIYIFSFVRSVRRGGTESYNSHSVESCWALSCALFLCYTYLNIFLTELLTSLYCSFPFYCVLAAMLVAVNANYAFLEFDEHLRVSRNVFSPAEISTPFAERCTMRNDGNFG